MSAASTAAASTIALPAVAALIGLPLARRNPVWGREWAVLAAAATLVAAVVEAWAVYAGHGVSRVPFLGNLDVGGTRIALDLRADVLSATVALAVGFVALGVQLYSTAYLAELPDDPLVEQAPTRYPAYAATVSLFTAAMMTVVHANDLVLLLVGWEVMGACSYLLIGHHSERAAARAAAVKAFLVTRVGDLGVLIAVVLLLAAVGTTDIPALLAAAPGLPHGTVLAAALLLLAGVAGKSAQFPLHTWLPDAMEGPTPVSALIHAATMVAAGVYLVARLLPLYLAAPAALDVAAVIAAVTMLGAALAALAQEDLKRLLAWSTVSQVAYMLGGVAVARAAVGGAAPGIFHLLTHAAFKALLFLVAGCLAQIAGSTALRDMGGLRRTHRSLAWLLALGLAALAGLPPLSGFWSKEAVLSAAEHATDTVGWPAQLVLASGLLTTLVTGAYAGRALAIVAFGDPPPTPETVAEIGAHTVGTGETFPPAMVWPLWALAVPTALLGFALFWLPAAVRPEYFDVRTAVAGTALAVVGLTWGLEAAATWEDRDAVLALPAGLRTFLRDGYRIDEVQQALVVRPYQASARLVRAADSDVIDGYVRAVPVLTRWGSAVLARAQSGLATGYVAWLAAGAVVLGLIGLVLT
ncbi:MAG TPA: NADH-quinone oxidoreductase subunit L [Kineosporiaceae bacterium]|nr:NADH-quinone oxidoreductase subunit L [Kineosporiaceae bacterium]